MSYKSTGILTIGPEFLTMPHSLSRVILYRSINCSIGVSPLTWHWCAAVGMQLRRLCSLIKNTILWSSAYFIAGHPGNVQVLLSKLCELNASGGVALSLPAFGEARLTGPHGVVQPEC